MNDGRDIVPFRIDRKTGISILAALAVVSGGVALSEQLTITTSYPVPSGIYNQLITTGNSGSTPVDTTFNRNAGNTVLVPPTNASGAVGIRTASPKTKLLQVPGLSSLSGEIGLDIESSVLIRSGRYGLIWGNTSMLSPDQGGSIELGAFGGNPGVGNANTAGQTPYIDFHYGNGLIQDYNVRVINDGDNQLTVAAYNGAVNFNVLGNEKLNGSLTAAGLITSTYSDERLKRDIAPIQDALEKVSRLTPVRYKWKKPFAASHHLSGATQWGLVAQDVERVLPDLVSKDESGYRRLTYGNQLNMLALASIKQLNERAEQDQARIRVLEAEVQALKSRAR